MEAASGGYVEVGRVLLDKVADVNAPPVPSSRDTALTIAADKGHYRFVELLLERYLVKLSKVDSFKFPAYTSFVEYFDHISHSFFQGRCC